MDNKDEKTFTDLFSSFKDEPQVKTKTFGDILNNSMNNEEVSSSDVTFDGLFEQLNVNEEQKENSTITFNNDIIGGEENNSKTVLRQDSDNYAINELEEATKTMDNLNLNENNINFGFNSFLNSNDSSGEKNINSSEPTLEDSIIESNPLFEESSQISEAFVNNNLDSNNNLFVNQNDSAEENSMNSIIESNPLFEESSQISEAFVDNNLDSNNNLFVNQNDSAEENSMDSTIESNPLFEENTTIDEVNTNNNPFFKENTNQKIENAIDLNNNPFMSVDSSIEENKNESIESILDDSPITINPLFEEKTQIEESNIEDNPFFSTDNSQTSIIIDDKKELEVVPPESASPFFEEEKKNEENPFFQNQLNLVENKVPDNPKGTIDSSKSKHYNVKIVKKKEPLIKLILGVLSYALFIWLLLIGITLLVYVLDIKIRAAKGDYSSPTFNAYVVLTGSMLPEIEVYDVVVTKKVDGEKLKEGDVITFASTDTRFFDTIITHRIIKKNPPSDTEGYTFQTKGDNNNVADSALVPDNRIFGKVILKIPKLGYLQEFLASRGGWIIVILIPCLTVISYDTVKLIKGLKRKKYKNIKVQK